MGKRLGEVRHEGGRIVLRYERRLASPPQAVWRAVTESDRLRHWLPCDIVGERRAGSPIVLPFWPEHVERYDIADHLASLTGEIRVWDPPSVFEWTWDDDVLRWELEPQGDDTLLVFTTVIGQSHEAEYDWSQVAAGYHVCLEQLQELIDTGTVRQPLIDVPVTEWEAEYARVADSAR